MKFNWSSFLALFGAGMILSTISQLLGLPTIIYYTLAFAMGWFWPFPLFIKKEENVLQDKE